MAGSGTRERFVRHELRRVGFFATKSAKIGAGFVAVSRAPIGAATFLLQPDFCTFCAHRETDLRNENFIGALQ